MNGRSILFCAVFFMAALAALPADETKMEVSVVPGNTWTGKMKAGIFTVKKTPQMAVWVEDADGSFVSTLTVTGKAAKNKWLGNPENGRPDALPVWNHAALPAGKVVDAASSATPKGAVALERTEDGLVAGKEYTVFLEVNASFDYNDSWPENAKEGEAGYSGVNGQPSLVYKGTFVAGTPAVVKLEPYGTGSVDGSTGDIVAGFEGLTTALSMIESASVTIK